MIDITFFFQYLAIIVLILSDVLSLKYAAYVIVKDSNSWTVSEYKLEKL